MNGLLGGLFLFSISVLTLTIAGAILSTVLKREEEKDDGRKEGEPRRDD